MPHDNGAPPSEVIEPAEGAFDAMIPQLLRSIDADLELRLAPEIRTADGKTVLDIIRMLLHWAISRLERGAGLDAQHMTELAQLLEQCGAADSPRLPSFLSCGLLEKVAEIETRYYAGHDPESVSDPATAYLGGKSSGRSSFAGTEMRVDEQVVTAYLRRRFTEHPEARAKRVCVLTGGLSKETIFFDLTGCGDRDGGVVLRKDFPQRGTDVSSIDEFPLLQAMYRNGLPVPEPLWAEPDSDRLGTAFIALRRVAGTVALEEDLSNAAVRGHFIDRLAYYLAQLHQITPDWMSSYARGATADVSALVRDQMRHWRTYWQRTRIAKDPVMDFLFDWMMDNVPADPGYAPSIVHGDYGFHNLLVKNGEVSAILDWEFSHLGDPIEDVAYVRQFVDPMSEWESFRDRYAAHGGYPYSDSRASYFFIWQNVRNACLCNGSLHAFTRGRPGNIRLAGAGIGYFARFKLAALRQIATRSRSLESVRKS